MAPPRVLVDMPHTARVEDRERLAAAVDIVPVSEPLDEAGLIEALRGCAGLIRLGGRVPAVSGAVLEAAADLQLVGLRSDRFGHGIDLEAAAARGVRVVDADNIASAHPVAEWDLALILMCLRNAGYLYRQMIAGVETWANAGNERFVNGELTGRRVGLVGCGHVGQRLVELLAPFRVDLRVCDPYLPDDTAAALGIVRADLDATLEHADILVVQVPLTPKTRGLIGAEQLERLGEGRILINCSRGPVVDQAALVERLQARQLIAGLDVFDPEPLPPAHPLRQLPNVFCTPHIAWYAPNVLHRYFAFTVDEFLRFYQGEPLQYELTQRMVDIRHGRM